MSGKLIVVGTPIGNLSDFSPRAEEALREADFIAAEDTRVTRKLMAHFEIHKPLISYFEHNKYERGKVLCSRMQGGETCALVSDAGMPAISDPGELLVAQCAEQGIPVTVVPGPSAVVSALAVSGLPTGRFTFEGFLSVNKKSRREHLTGLKNEERTMVFYEAPHRLTSTLEALASVLGNRNIGICRELTKVHEEILRFTLEEAMNYYESNDAKGEFVLVVEGKDEKELLREESEKWINLSIEKHIKMYMEDGLDKKEAIKKVAKDRKLSKSEVYKHSLSL